jgi:hypothetical protein
LHELQKFSQDFLIILQTGTSEDQEKDFGQKLDDKIKMTNKLHITHFIMF